MAMCKSGRQSIAAVSNSVTSQGLPSTASTLSKSAETTCTAVARRNSNSSSSTAHSHTRLSTKAVPLIRVVSADFEQASPNLRTPNPHSVSLYCINDYCALTTRLSPHPAAHYLPRQQTPVIRPASAPCGPSDRPPMSSSKRWSMCRLLDTGERRERSDFYHPHQGDNADLRMKYELAGRLDDWEGINVSDVDRYGFIVEPRPMPSSATPETIFSPTLPRKRNVLVKKSAREKHAAPSPPPSRTLRRTKSTRSFHTQVSAYSSMSRKLARPPLRAVAKLLPHMRDRERLNEAGEMLSLPPTLADISENGWTGEGLHVRREKECERSEKWRKMAKVVRKGGKGEGMDFEFDTNKPKLIARVWKGIPDRWRAAAWYSFLAASARRHESSESEANLITEFRRLQDLDSPDDGQIDLDVPRTINGHVMFRKRYEGGQRLLFRVLHAISLYFPDVGYCQGMAPIAATLLCYFEEEKCFVMLVRLWRFRGLKSLYERGFGGLMTALTEFEMQWLRGHPAAKDLSEMSIDPTAYGTRWYLTLFNLSIPFPAQLRVWDVYLLLGEPPSPGSVGQGLAILHACSLALIDALGNVLVGSDYENAMKVLTSFVPVRDEDILMKVAQSELSKHQARGKF